MYQSVKSTINRVLSHTLGYQLQKCPNGHNVSLEFSHILAKRFVESSDFCFIQIGAHDGIRFDGLYEFVTSHNCRGVVVEPIRDYFLRLCENYQKYPRVIPVNAAVHATDRFIDIHRLDPQFESQVPDWVQGSASILREHLSAHVERFELPPESVVSERVPCVTIADIVSQYELLQVDLLQIDVEGYDFEVLKMIPFGNLRPHIIKWEHKNLDAADRDRAEQLVIRNGYQLWRGVEDSAAVLRT